MPYLVPYWLSLKSSSLNEASHWLDFYWRDFLWVPLCLMRISIWVEGFFMQNLSFSVFLSKRGPIICFYVIVINFEKDCFVSLVWFQSKPVLIKHGLPYFGVPAHFIYPFTVFPHVSVSLLKLYGYLSLLVFRETFCCYASPIIIMPLPYCTLM